jgi:hypothetical protein
MNLPGFRAGGFALGFQNDKNKKHKNKKTKPGNA